MGAVIRTRIIKIGNSQGIRIPKTLLEQSGIKSEVQIEVEGEQITIRNATKLRQGWDQAFVQMALEKSDHLLDEINPTDWEQTEWDW